MGEWKKRWKMGRRAMRIGLVCFLWIVSSIFCLTIPYLWHRSHGLYEGVIYRWPGDSTRWNWIDLRHSDGIISLSFEKAKNRFREWESFSDPWMGCAMETGRAGFAVFHGSTYRGPYLSFRFPYWFAAVLGAAWPVFAGVRFAWRHMRLLMLELRQRKVFLAE